MSYNLSISQRLELYPLVPIAIGLIGGIVVGEHFKVSYSALLTTMIAIVALAMLTAHIWKLRLAITLSWIVFVGALGIFLTRWESDRQDFTESGQYEEFHAIAKTEPSPATDGEWVVVEGTDGRMEGKTIRLHIIYNNEENHSRDILGKCLSVRAKFRHPRNFNDAKFDYPLYLKSHGIWAIATAYPNNWAIIENHDFNLSPIENIKIFFIAKRRTMIERLRSLGMDEQAFAVTAAMSLGDKSEVSRATSNIYSIAGTSHVLALSGLHLSIVFGLFAVFGGRWRRSVPAVVLSVLALWTYVLVAGSPVSMIRSALMLSVSLLIGLSGRNGVTLNTLSFSAILILLANPFAIHDVGFQLSFASVAFLGAFASDICRILSAKFLLQHRFMRWCWQMAITSTVAQMGTTPLVAYHFGRMPLLFIPANFIAIPAATALLYLAVAFFLLLWMPWVSETIGWALSLISSILNSSMTYIASLKWSSLTIENVSIADTIAMYAIAIAVLAILQCIGRWSSDKAQRSLAWAEIHCIP